MSKIESAINWAVAIANDNSHGYSQNIRWGPHYDCSSFLISAYQQAGVPVKTNGATYTGNMYSAFLKSGFSDVKSKVNLSTGAGLLRGDVLLDTVNHTVMYLGNNQIVHASSPTNGILVQGYYAYGWTHVLRLNEAKEEPIMEGEDNMVCFYQVDKKGAVYFYDGHDIHGIAHPDEQHVLNMIYKANTGKDIPFFSWTSSAPWHVRLKSAITRPA